MGRLSFFVIIDFSTFRTICMSSSKTDVLSVCVDVKEVAVWANVDILWLLSLVKQLSLHIPPDGLSCLIKVKAATV